MKAIARSFICTQRWQFVTNIDLEHLDVFKDIDDIKQTFLQFLNNLPFYGKAILCIDDAAYSLAIAALSLKNY